MQLFNRAEYAVLFISFCKLFTRSNVIYLSDTTILTAWNSARFIGGLCSKAINKIYCSCFRYNAVVFRTWVSPPPLPKVLLMLFDAGLIEQIIWTAKVELSGVLRYETGNACLASVIKCTIKVPLIKGGVYWHVKIWETVHVSLHRCRIVRVGCFDLKIYLP